MKIEFTPVEVKTTEVLRIFHTKINDPEMDKLIVNEIDKQGDKQNNQTNVKAPMTEWRMMDKPGFSKLRDIILDACLNISVKFNKTYSPFIMNDMWGMKYQSGDHAHLHDHFPSIFSITYYPKIEGDVPTLDFPQANYFVKAEQGLLTIFPSFMYHGVKKENWKGTRYCVSANVFSGIDDRYFEEGFWKANKSNIIKYDK